MKIIYFLICFQLLGCKNGTAVIMEPQNPINVVDTSRNTTPTGSRNWLCDGIRTRLPKSDSSIVLTGILTDHTFIADQHAMLEFSKSKKIKPIDTNNAIVFLADGCSKDVVLPSMDSDSFDIPINSKVTVVGRVYYSYPQISPLIVVDKVSLLK